MAVDADRLVERYDELLADRQPWHGIWQEICDNLMPSKATIDSTRAPGSRITDERWSSAGARAHAMLSAHLQGTLTSKAFQWFFLRSTGADDAAKQWLQQAERVVFDAINASNFQSQMHETYLDLVGLGTASLWVEQAPGRDTWNGLLFTSYPIHTYVFEEDAWGRASACARTLTLTGRQLRQRYAELPAQLKTLINKDPRRKHEVIHWVYQRDEVQDLEKPYASVHIWKEKRRVLAEAGYDEFPVMIPRWSKTTTEPYGHGPGELALPEMRVLNKVVELDLTAAAKNIDPPMKYRAGGIVGEELDMRSGGLTAVQSMDDLMPINSGYQPQIAQLKVQELRTAIQQTFFADQLELPPFTSQTMTATEVQVRYELMQRILGPTLGRIETELLAPLVSRCFRLLLRAGRLGQPPQSLQGQETSIHYEGPLARAERRAEVNKVQVFVQGAAPFMQIAPEVTDLIDADRAVRLLAEAENVDRTILRSDEQVQAIRRGRQEQQAQAQGIDQGKALSETALNLSRAQGAAA